MARIVRLLSPAVLAGIALALPVSGAAAAPCPDAGLMPGATNVAQLRTATLCLLNVERNTRGLAPLTSKAAQAYSAKMVRMRFFDQVCPQGTTPSSRSRKFCVEFRDARP